MSFRQTYARINVLESQVLQKLNAKILSSEANRFWKYECIFTPKIFV